MVERAVDGTIPHLDETLVRRLLSDADLLFVQLTGDGTITWIGDACTPMLGLDPADVIGRHIVDFVHPDDQEPAALTMAEEARGGFERVSMVIRIRHADGRWISYEFGGIDTREADGTGSYLVWGRSYETTNRLMDFLAALMAGAPLPELLRHVVDWFDGDSSSTATALLVRDDAGRFACEAANERLPPELRPTVAVEAGGTAPWDLAARPAGPGRHAIAGTGDFEGIDPALATAAEALGWASCWSVPIGGSGGRPDALMVIWHPRRGPLLVSHLARIASAIAIVGLATSWSRQRAALVRAATTDPLTGLANRSHLAELMEQHHDATAAVLICDLDGFKAVNDRHGHLVGDRVLVAVAQRMRSCTPRDVVVARIGGDEFAVWVPSVPDPGTATALAERLLACFGDPVEVDGTPHDIGCSIGIAVLPAGDHQFDRMLGAADRALYAAKAQGRGRWVLADT